MRNVNFVKHATCWLVLLFIVLFYTSSFIDWLHEQHEKDPWFPLGFCMLCGMAIMAIAGVVGQSMKNYEDSRKNENENENENEELR